MQSSGQPNQQPTASKPMPRRVSISDESIIQWVDHVMQWAESQIQEAVAIKGQAAAILAELRHRQAGKPSGGNRG